MSTCKNLFMLVVILKLCACKPTNLEYRIGDSYIGPCVVFIYPNWDVAKEGEVYINNGLGRISQKNIKSKFVFKSTEKGTELAIIPIGKEHQVSDTGRYIFRLLKGVSETNCVKGEIHMIRFFVGNKHDFSNWVSIYHDELDYFDSTGVNWCNYYKELIK
jgi:hypothetical protein